MIQTARDAIRASAARIARQKETIRAFAAEGDLAKHQMARELLILLEKAHGLRELRLQQLLNAGFGPWRPGRRGH